METQFSKGDLVVARVAAQGMVLGAQYKVVSVHPNQTPFGLFVAYELRAKGGKKFTVRNLHYRGAAFDVDVHCLPGGRLALGVRERGGRALRACDQEGRPLPERTPLEGANGTAYIMRLR